MLDKMICLWWFDTNWKSKGAAEHLVVVIDFEHKIIKKNITYGEPSGLKCLEVKRKTELTEYVNALEKRGFKVQ